ncbi:hypothetical protein BCR34DRAFT_596315 [Clohesyomyces aquaticus]|uniref:Uncharacterized protein n=1 Tax=Clohesyomyces aquaticus TaxID=1231657 RepID=A0A1Y2A7C2_9PLEO|nr:hypothetical protein BCR34DRAFT_596315 [Clohesyomyces aquaticus]
MSVPGIKFKPCADAKYEDLPPDNEGPKSRVYDEGLQARDIEKETAIRLEKLRVLCDGDVTHDCYPIIQGAAAGKVDRSSKIMNGRTGSKPEVLPRGQSFFPAKLELSPKQQEAQHEALRRQALARQCHEAITYSKKIYDDAVQIDIVKATATLDIASGNNKHPGTIKRPQRMLAHYTTLKAEPVSPGFQNTALTTRAEVLSTKQIHLHLMSADLLRQRRPIPATNSAAGGLISPTYSFGLSRTPLFPVVGRGP